MSLPTCPSQEHLAAYHRGTVPNDVLATITAHLEGKCSSCAAILLDFERDDLSADPLSSPPLFLQTLPQPQPHDPTLAARTPESPGTDVAELTDPPVRHNPSDVKPTLTELRPPAAARAGSDANLDVGDILSRESEVPLAPRSDSSPTAKSPRHLPASAMPKVGPRWSATTRSCMNWVAAAWASFTRPFIAGSSAPSPSR